MKISKLFPPQLRPRQGILATQTLVVQMPMLLCEARVASARVDQNTSETRTAAAGPSVLSTPTVTERLPVEGTTSATTPVPEPAASTRSAK